MIKVDLLGRFGNQMFQYAFAFATAKIHNTRFLITPTAPFEPAKYFELDWRTHFFYTAFPYNRYFIKLFSELFPKYYHQKRFIEDQSESVDQQHHYSYQGYFQSEKYFAPYKNEIKKAFSLKQKWIDEFDKKYGELFKKNKTIIIHVRRTDYLHFEVPNLGGKDLSLPFSYYRNCLKQIPNISDYKILCISDDIGFVKDNLVMDQDISFETNTMITDFQLIQNANIAIIANSSFGWWGAYLNNKAETIFAPKYWLGFKVNVEYSKDIIPEKFTQVDVY